MCVHDELNFGHNRRPLLFRCMDSQRHNPPLVPSIAQIQHFLHNETAYVGVLQLAARWVAGFDAWDKNLGKPHTLIASIRLPVVIGLTAGFVTRPFM